MDFLVGSFNQSELFVLSFTPPGTSAGTSNEGTLSIVRRVPALSGHSWLSLSADQRFLYGTCWGQKTPSVAAYAVHESQRDIQYLNSKPIRNLSGYVCVSQTHLFSAGGATGEVFRLEPDGSIGELVQELEFVENTTADPNTGDSNVPHGDFGGVRFGAHSIDLSPDGRALYVADIGRNCVWTFTVDSSHHTGQVLHHQSKFISPRAHDGPRHTWPHPSGKHLYSLEEHSSMVDVYAVAEDGVTLTLRQACAILPDHLDCRDFWADEVRVSARHDGSAPQYLYASTRGLHSHTKGYVTVFALREDGTLADEKPIVIWETPTSGGIANAIEPAPHQASFGDVEYIALTDSEEGWVFVLGFDGKSMVEVARVNLGRTKDGEVIGAATSVWLNKPPASLG